jgi:hypothetical protein
MFPTKITKVAAGLLAVASFGMLSGRADAATGVTAPHRSGAVNCGTFPGRNVSIATPAMLAVNATTATDYQNVAYKPVVFKWVNSSWTYFSEDGWMTATASDATSPQSWVDPGGQRYTSGTSFATNVTSGYYRVAIRYYWYATSRVGSGSDYLWATAYANQDGSTSASYCTVP